MPDRPVEPAEDQLGGEAACLLHLVCEECGALLTATSGHRPGCSVLQGSQTEEEGGTGG